MSFTSVTYQLAKSIRYTHPNLAISLLISEGFCFGSSFCHAAFESQGALPWWNAALNAVDLLNLDAESATKKISLPGELSEQTLSDIFTRVLNYVLFTHSQKNKHIMQLDNQSQDMMLEVQGGFEMVGSDKKIKTIKSRHTTPMQLMLPAELDLKLDAKRMPGKMTTVANYVHQISVFYEDPFWCVYDPNYSNEDKTKNLHKLTYQKFLNKTDALKVIYESLGSILSVTTCSFEAEETKEIKEFKKVEEDEKTILLQSMNKIISKEDRANFLENELISDRYGCGFFSVAKYLPALLPGFLRLISQGKNGAVRVAQFLECKGNPFDSSYFAYSYLKATEDLKEHSVIDRLWIGAERIISREQKESDGNPRPDDDEITPLVEKKDIPISQNEDGIPWPDIEDENREETDKKLQYIAHLIYQNYVDVEEKCLPESELLKKISEIKEIPVQDNSAFFILTEHAPDVLSEMFKIFLEHEEGFEEVANAFHACIAPPHKVGLDFLFKSTVNFLPDLFDILSKTDKGLDCLGGLLNHIVCNDDSKLDQLILIFHKLERERGSHLLNPLLSLKNKAEPVLFNIIKYGKAIKLGSFLSEPKNSECIASALKLIPIEDLKWLIYHRPQGLGTLFYAAFRSPEGIVQINEMSDETVKEIMKAIKPLMHPANYTKIETNLFCQKKASGLTSSSSSHPFFSSTILSATTTSHAENTTPRI